MTIRMATILAAPVILVAAGLPVAAAATTPNTTTPDDGTDASLPGLTEVVATDSVVTVTGSADPGAEVDVFALGMHEDEGAWTDAEPAGEAVADGDGSFTVDVSRSDSEGSDPIYAKYVAVSNDAQIGVHRYIDTLDITPASDRPYPNARTKKGLQVKMTDDAEELGVEHAAVNVVINRLMVNDHAGVDDAIHFESGGETYYFDQEEVDSLDRQIKSLSDNGALVNLILLLQDRRDEPTAVQELIHPDADFAGGPIFGFNTVTEDGVRHLTAAFEFMADRWSRDDGAHGRVVGYIVGNEVDAQWVWSNSGEKTLEQFLADYEKALRLAYLTTQRAWSGARVYTSLTHSWTTPAGPADPTGRYYPGKDVVDELVGLTQAHGDYPWNIAHHPYPEDLRNPAFWNDQTATDDVDTSPRITFKNIALLSEYLRRAENTYEGEPRRVILSEQGCNTPGEDLAAEELQAACYALAYYKIRFLPEIDNFILHRHVDHLGEGGLRLGLWTWDEERSEGGGWGETEGDAPDQQKVIYDVFKYIDTERSLEVTEFAKEIIGIDDWSELVDGFDPDALAERPIPIVAGASTAARPIHPTTVSSFDDDTDGWRSADNATGVTAVDGVLQVSFDENGRLWRGADVVLPEQLDATAMPYLGLRMRVPDQDDLGTVRAKVKVYGADGTVGEGVAVLSAHDGWQRVTLDLSGWDGQAAISRIKVWARAETNQNWTGSFDVDDVVLAPKVAPGSVTNLEVTGRIVGEPTVGADVEISVTNNDIGAPRTDLAAVSCDGVTVDPATVPVSGLDAGESATVTAELVAFNPGDPAAPRLCLAGSAGQFDIVLHVEPPAPTAVFDFDDGTTQGWVAGANVADISATESMLNGPGSPQGGSHMVAAVSDAVAVDAPRTVMVELDEPLDLTDAVEVVTWVNSYGGAPGASGFEVIATLWSGNEQHSVTADDYAPDRWNEIVIDVSGWAGRSAITKMEVSFRGLGSSTSWAPHFQVDEIGYYTRERS